MKTGLVMENEVDQDGLEQKDVDMLADSISRAVKLFKDAETYKTMQVEAMAAADSYSWSNSAKQYVEVFSSL